MSAEGAKCERMWKRKVFVHLGECIQPTLREPSGAAQDGTAAALGTPSCGSVLVGTVPCVVLTSL